MYYYYNHHYLQISLSLLLSCFINFTTVGELMSGWSTMAISKSHPCIRFWDKQVSFKECITLKAKVACPGRLWWRWRCSYLPVSTRHVRHTRGSVAYLNHGELPTRKCGLFCVLRIREHLWFRNQFPYSNNITFIRRAHTIYPKVTIITLVLRNLCKCQLNRDLDPVKQQKNKVEVTQLPWQPLEKNHPVYIKVKISGIWVP